MRTTLLLMLTLMMALPALASESDLAITVYNQGIGLVREARGLNLDRGVQDYTYDGVAARIVPTSVRFEADDVTILEQNYEYDLVSQQALMEKHLGQTIDVLLDDELITGRLLSTSGGIVLETERGIRMINSDKLVSVSFPELPEGLIIKPTLRWQLHAARGGDTDAVLSYLTHGLSWEASYVAVLNEDDTGLELSGWVQLTNESGADYAVARLKLMAGDVQIMKSSPAQQRRFAGDVMMEAAAGPGFEEKEFFEYHLYTLPRPVTVSDNQVKQIRLIEPSDTGVEKHYTYNAWRGGSDVAVELSFENAEDAGLGLPLPAGLVRMFKEDPDDGTLQLIGEDRIDHTPRDEEIHLSTGNAFDIVGERRRMDTQRINNRIREDSYEVELRNRKDEDIEVIVRERFYGDWRVVRQSQAGEKIDATTCEWVVTVPAREEVTLSYKVRTQ